MTDKEKNEVLFDALLKVAVTEAFEKEMNALPFDEELKSYTPSPELDRRINILIDKSYRKTKIRRNMKRLGKIAACVCIVFTISSVILLSVSATRNAVFNAIIEWQEKYTEVKFDDSTTDSDIYRPTYLPEGFSETSNITFGNTVMLTYSNEAGDEIILNQRPAESGTSLVDNENTSYTEVEISGVTGYLFIALLGNDPNALIWQLNGEVFELSSKIDNNELIKIAESIKK